ncbi:MAG TPA: hypothetical protein VN026_04380 [Bacteroidia bacterium]|jgi:hypothetical protein|nr:hypothetical protein [Bacteroidia bacterium]
MSPLKKLPHKKHYYNALLKSISISLTILFVSLAIGVWGYSHFFHFGWIDGLLNASMILGGMGPVDPAPDDNAKLFASFYALYSGVAFLTSFAILFSPVMHRFLHRFHLDMEE